MISDRPTLVCADGDDAGLVASQKWVRTFMAHGRETIVTILPNGHDPASWLREHGAEGLSAFTRRGGLDLPDDAVTPIPAASLLAERILVEEIAAARKHDPNTETVVVVPVVLDRLAVEAIKVPGGQARRRFAGAAGDTLAKLVDGMSATGRASQVLDAANRRTGPGREVPIRATVDAGTRRVMMATELERLGRYTQQAPEHAIDGGLSC